VPSDVRARAEEALLNQAVGKAYADDCRRTKRFLPDSRSSPFTDVDECWGTCSGVGSERSNMAKTVIVVYGRVENLPWHA
jgi:hypothetical protein